MLQLDEMAIHIILSRYKPNRPNHIAGTTQGHCIVRRDLDAPNCSNHLAGTRSTTRYGIGKEQDDFSHGEGEIPSEAVRLLRPSIQLLRPSIPLVPPCSQPQLGITQLGRWESSLSPGIKHLQASAHAFI